ncbi:expressed unknown protein [Seminavis robusta]|uniref:Uncharacterized protein n=1 Tax=Seminavis robusta TaxID=568900 RepID=A0A9N8EG54_9STRA|nr:expressed unknown protein [Seminavis robusta]|eukprot:Sro887_g216330.1 n/a (493) ;mRNA; r:31853-33331
MAREQCRDPPGERIPCSFIDDEEASVASIYVDRPTISDNDATRKHSQEGEGDKPNVCPRKGSKSGSTTGSTSSANTEEGEDNQESVASHDEEPKMDHLSDHSLTEESSSVVPSEDQLDQPELEAGTCREAEDGPLQEEPRDDPPSHLDSLGDTSSLSLGPNPNNNQLNPKLSQRELASTDCSSGCDQTTKEGNQENDTLHQEEPNPSQNSSTEELSSSVPSEDQLDLKEIQPHKETEERSHHQEKNEPNKDPPSQKSSREEHPSSSSALVASGASKTRRVHRRRSLQYTATPAGKPTKGLRRFFQGRRGSLDSSIPLRRGLRRSEADMAVKRTMFRIRPSVLQTAQQQLDSSSASQEEEEIEVAGEEMESLPGAVAVPPRELRRRQTNSSIPVAIMVDDDSGNEDHQQEVEALRRLVEQKDSKIEALEQELAVLRQRLNMETVIAEPLSPVFGGDPAPNTTSTQHDRQDTTLTEAEKYALNVLLRDKRGRGT